MNNRLESDSPQPATQVDGCYAEPKLAQQELILINPIDYKFADRFYTEDAAREAAMAVARANPGVPISVARILRTALVPLPNVEWSFGAPPAPTPYGRSLAEDAQIKQKEKERENR